jgi:hypothetical protein
LNLDADRYSGLKPPPGTCPAGGYSPRRRHCLARWRSHSFAIKTAWVAAVALAGLDAAVDVWMAPGAQHNAWREPSRATTQQCQRVHTRTHSASDIAARAIEAAVEPLPSTGKLITSLSALPFAIIPANRVVQCERTRRRHAYPVRGQYTGLTETLRATPHPDRQCTSHTMSVVPRALIAEREFPDQSPAVCPNVRQANSVTSFSNTRGGRLVE